MGKSYNHMDIIYRFFHNGTYTYMLRELSLD